MKQLILFSFSLLLFSCAKPLAKFQYEKSKKVAPALVSFSNGSESADSFSWDFGDGNFSTEMNPTHTFLLSGNYDVKLTAIKGGKKTIAKQTISIEAPKECLIHMETNMGNLVFKLYDQTPKHRDNFIKISDDGYYSDLLFHRVINNFMVQGGDPKSRGAAKGVSLGSGGPSYKVDAEFNSSLAHVKGALAAARQGGPINPKKKSSGSQFYIVHGKKVTAASLDQMEVNKGIEYTEETKAQYLKMGGTPFLDMEYTVFGQLIEGWDVLDKMAGVETDVADRPIDDVIIKKVTVIK